MSYRFLILRHYSWRRHQMETFSALLAQCAGNSRVTGEFLAQRPVTRSFDVSFDLHLNKHLSKQSRGWWSETLSRTLWRHYNARPLFIGWYTALPQEISQERGINWHLPDYSNIRFAFPEQLCLRPISILFEVNICHLWLDGHMKLTDFTFSVPHHWLQQPIDHKCV